MSLSLGASRAAGSGTRGRTSYGPLAVAIASIILLGFVPSYWWPIVLGPESVRPFVHLHAALFFGWAGLFALQSVLVSAGRTPLHRKVGVLSAAWAAVTILVSFRLALETIARDLDLVDGTRGAVLTLIPLTQVSMFTAFVALGLAKLRTPEVHKRFMTLAALVAVTPAVGRIGIAMLGADSPVLPVFALSTSTALLVGVVWHDTRRSRRLHPVFLYGALAVVLVRVARVPFSTSDAWRSTAEAIAALVTGQGQ